MEFSQRAAKRADALALFAWGAMSTIAFARGDASTGFNVNTWGVWFLLSMLGDTDTTSVGNATQVTYANTHTTGGPSTIVPNGSFSNGVQYAG